MPVLGHGMGGLNEGRSSIHEASAPNPSIQSLHLLADKISYCILYVQAWGQSKGRMYDTSQPWQGLSFEDSGFPCMQDVVCDRINAVDEDLTKRVRHQELRRLVSRPMYGRPCGWKDGVMSLVGGSIHSRSRVHLRVVP